MSLCSSDLTRLTDKLCNPAVSVQRWLLWAAVKDVGRLVDEGAVIRAID